MFARSIHKAQICVPPSRSVCEPRLVSWEVFELHLQSPSDLFLLRKSPLQITVVAPATLDICLRSEGRSNIHPRGVDAATYSFLCPLDQKRKKDRIGNCNNLRFQRSVGDESWPKPVAIFTRRCLWKSGKRPFSVVLLIRSN